ncbi:YaaL family protein [Sporosarcina aquimarina]|uniref:YaaL family protein n=1 Tax=Sporosarcina aquimarina TaxID=114975 RepID=A0ABU4G4V5_9BACL|nr:YaaL family protein [Sporosarcina aquimarina]MDW0111385.1 YaaL family protein [Sporosarcina aquimarina]
MKRSGGLFRRKHKIKREYDEKLRALMLDTREEWERAKSIEKYADDFDQEVLIHRKIAECNHFYLYKEAKIRNLGIE